MNVCEILSQLAVAEKERNTALDNLTKIEQQFNSGTIEGEFWKTLKEGRLFDQEVYDNEKLCWVNMDTFMQEVRKGSLSKKKIQIFRESWNSAIKVFIDKKTSEIERLKQQLEEDYEKFTSDNSEIVVSRETFIESLLQFIMT